MSSLELIKENRGRVTRSRLLTFIKALEYKDLREVNIYNLGGIYYIQSERNEDGTTPNLNLTAQDYDGLLEIYNSRTALIDWLYNEFNNKP